MTNTWVKIEATRIIKATCERDRKRDGIPKGGHSPCCHAEEVAESCLRAGRAYQEETIRRVEFERGKRAGLLEAARRLEAHAVGCYHESAEGDSACFTWMDRHRDAARYAVELRALAGEEPSHE